MTKKLTFLTSLLILVSFVITKVQDHQPILEAPPTVSAAQVDYFLKIDGIEGESEDPGHEGEIDILSWSWGDEDPAAALLLPAVQSARNARGRVEFSDIAFEAHINKSSPKLMEAIATGKALSQVTLFGLRANDTSQQFLIIKLHQVRVSSYQVGGSSSDVVPVDNFSFNYEKVEYEYVPQNEDGSSGNPVKFAWDVRRNQPFDATN